jgi:anti-sigma factor RsiW
MNCEKCHELISDFVDGVLTTSDEAQLSAHLGECLDCAEVRQDLGSIVSFCREHRGEYAAPPNERALWLRIRNIVESETGQQPATQPSRSGFFGGWLGRSWELSLPQMAASVAAIILVVSLATVVGLKRWQNSNSVTASSATDGAASVRNRVWEQQQLINYWNQRVEVNKARWSPQMRETFDRNLKVIDQAVNDSLNDLSRNPHDEVSEEMLNQRLNEKLSLLKDFSDL